MKLTDEDAWKTFHSEPFPGYDADTTIGRYSLMPAEHNCDRNLLIGYRAYLFNDRGRLPGSPLHVIEGSPVPLPEAHKLCQKHMEAHDGEVVNSTP